MPADSHPSQSIRSYVAAARCARTTVTLVWPTDNGGGAHEIAFKIWLFGGGDIQKLEDVKLAAAYFGMAFQIADDIEDMEQDLKNGHKVNMALNFGKEKAREMIQDEIGKFSKIMETLGLESLTYRI